ncbi:MAG TPA: hypothetical protein VHE14_08285 [Solirubrobacteraceae bacterium]|nr:hypothetical protein [Solirubrobacteraceae bacterium]
MKANRAYRLIVTRGGAGPAWLAGTDRIDHIEVVEIDSGEVVLFWDLDARAAARLQRRLKADLSQLDGEQFVAAWQDTQEPPAPATP